MTNPFDAVYSALWDLAVASEPLKQIVKLGNRIRFDNERNPIKENVASADFPELVLLDDGVSAVNINSSSCTTTITRRYNWLISTSDLRLNHLLHPVEWHLFCAMVGWQDCLARLRWRDAGYVKNARFVDASNAITDQQSNREFKGWSAIWRCEITMIFQTSKLLLENQ